MLVYAMISLFILNNTDPVKLNDFPYKLIVYNFQILGPSLYYVVLSTLLFSRNKSLKMFAKRLLFKNNTANAFPIKSVGNPCVAPGTL